MVNSESDEDEKDPKGDRERSRPPSRPCSSEEERGDDERERSRSPLRALSRSSCSAGSGADCKTWPTGPTCSSGSTTAACKAASSARRCCLGPHLCLSGISPRHVRYRSSAWDLTQGGRGRTGRRPGRVWFAGGGRVSSPGVSGGGPTCT